MGLMGIRKRADFFALFRKNTYPLNDGFSPCGRVV